MGWFAKHQAEQAELKARKAEIRAGKTFHRTGRQLNKAQRAQQKADRYYDAPPGWGRCVANNHLVYLANNDVCPTDGSQIRR